MLASTETQREAASAAAKARPDAAATQEEKEAANASVSA